MLWNLLTAGIFGTDYYIKKKINTSEKKDLKEKCLGGRLIVRNCHNHGMMLGILKNKDKEFLRDLASMVLGGAIWEYIRTSGEKGTRISKLGLSMIPEFIGRLPIIFTLNGLTEDMLVKILKEPKNAILKQYKKLLALDEVKLEFEDGALHAIARKALERHTGARALRAILEEYMLDIMYEIPKDDNIGEVVITEGYIQGNGGPKILMRGQEIPALEG